MQPFVLERPDSLAAALRSVDALVAESMAHGRNGGAAGASRSAGGPGSAGSLARGAGVDLLDLMKEGLLAPTRLVDLRDVPELQGIATGADGGLRIGSSVTIAGLAEACRSGPLQALGDAASHIAHPQIRNLATVGGSMLQRPRCWYFRLGEVDCRKKGGSSCPAIEGEHELHAIWDNAVCAAVHPATLATPLLALDARLELAGPDGARTLPLAEFFVPASEDPTRENVLRPREILLAIHVPAPEPGLVSRHHKQGSRDSYDWAFVDAAVALRRDGAGTVTAARIALGSVAHAPRRAPEAESVLVGHTLTEAKAGEAAAAALAGATPLPRNRFKLRMLETVLRRLLLAL